MNMEAITQQFSLQNQVAVVAGGGGGLGCELALILGDAGATVVLVDIDIPSMEKTALKLKQQKINYDMHACDITIKENVDLLIEKITKKHSQIDVLVNSAGVLGADEQMFSIESNDWDKVMDTNLKGTWLVSTAVAQHMADEKISGRIINISSSLGGRAQLNRIHYATSKAGVEHLTRNMAMELIKYNIRVNCLAPGWVATPMVQAILDGPDKEKWKKAIPMGRAAKPKELSGGLLLLASSASSYMTGSVLRIDGGYSFRGIELD